MPVRLTTTVTKILTSLSYQTNASLLMELYQFMKENSTLAVIITKPSCLTGLINFRLNIN